MSQADTTRSALDELARARADLGRDGFGYLIYQALTHGNVDLACTAIDRMPVGVLPMVMHSILLAHPFDQKNAADFARVTDAFLRKATTHMIHRLFIAIVPGAANNKDFLLTRTLDVWAGRGDAADYMMSMAMAALQHKRGDLVERLLMIPGESGQWADLLSLAARQHVDETLLGKIASEMTLDEIKAAVSNPRGDERARAAISLLLAQRERGELLEEVSAHVQRQPHAGARKL